MKLFSEKVQPTFTSSNHNILTVENYEEVFFDVYEFEINGEKFIAEKESTFKDSPVVSIPVEVGNKKYNAKFILNKGPQEVLFNEKNIDSIIEDTSEEVVFSNILEDISEPEDETIVFEKKENILQEINEAKSSAIDHVKQVKEQESLRAKKEFKDREDRLAQAIEESRKVVLDEFLSLTESTKEELFEHNDKNATNLRSKLFEYVNETFDKHSSKLSTSIEKDHTNSVKSLKNDIKTLAEEIYNSKASTIEVNLQDGFNTRVDEFNKVLDSKIDDLSNNILALEKANVDINDTLNKNTNKALSRVGSVKKDLEVSIKHLEEDVQAKFDTAEEKAKDYYDSKILTIEEALEEKDKDTREYILNIINENKNDLLDKFSNLKNNTTTTIVEQYGEKNVKIDPKKIQNEIQTNLTNTFSQQLLSLRKAVDMYSGGGSVAKQFANGGTMEGNLTVTGEITADKIFATTLLSASEVNYEFELSGFSVTGDISANGDLTVNQLSAIGSDSNYIEGSVGIGTTSPSTILEVSGQGVGAAGIDLSTAESSTISNRLFFTNNTVSQGIALYNLAGSLVFSTGAEPANTSGDARMYLTNGGNLGIGESSPGRTLHVNSAGANVTANFESTDAGAYLSFSDNSTTNDTYVRLGAVGDDFQFFAGGAERIRIDSAGDVGIGTTSPSAKLDVAGGIKLLDNNYLTWNTSNTRIIGNSDYLQLQVAGTDKVRIKSNGNVGIGTTDPGQKLTVSGSVSASDYLYVGNNNFLKAVGDGYLELGNTNSGVIQVGGDGSSSTIAPRFNNLIVKTSRDDDDIIFQAGASETELLRLDAGDTEIKIPDSIELVFGTGEDFKINHDGTNSGITNYTGDFYISNFADDKDIIFRADDGSGGYETYFLLDSSASSGNPIIRFPDNSIITLGTANDFYAFHNGSNTFLQNNTGDLYITNAADDKDIIFQADNGSGGDEVYFRLDGSFNTAGNPFTIFPDNSRIAAGNAADLSIFHNGTNSNIENITGNLIFTNYANDADIIFKCDDGSGGVETYFALEGDFSSGNPFTVFPDNSRLSLGSGADTSMYHTGSVTYFEHNTGDWYFIQNADDKDIIFQCDDGLGGTDTYLTFDGSARLIQFDALARFSDNRKAGFGNNSDLVIFHDGSNSLITNNTGNFNITQSADDGDIIFECDDGAGGVETYFFLDGSLSSGNPYTIFPDNSVLGFGAAADFNISHNGTKSMIKNLTGDLEILQYAGDNDILVKASNGSGGVENYLQFDGGGRLMRAYRNIRAQDDVYLQAGSSGDLEIVHASNHSYINNKTGDLYIQNSTDDKDVIFRTDDGSGALLTYFYLDGSLADGTNTYTVFPDNRRIRFGSDLDLDIHHDGSNSYISQTGTGSLNIQQTVDDGDLIFKCDNGSGGTTQYFRLDGGEVVNIFSKNVKLNDSIQLNLGGGNDLQLYHDGSNSYITNATGDMYFINSANDKDILFMSDDGSGGFATYLSLDGSEENVKTSKDLVQTPGSSVTPANNGELVVEATNNTTLTFKLKGSDGTVRSGTLTLS